MSLISLLLLLPGCSVEQVSRSEEGLLITACATMTSACCPDCQQGLVPSSQHLHAFTKGAAFEWTTGSTGTPGTPVPLSSADLPTKNLCGILSPAGSASRTADFLGTRPLACYWRGDGQMICGRNAPALEPWLKETLKGGVPELRTFAAGIKRDQAAVLASLTHDWSQGQVEGQTHRLKLLKRQSYGRAGFDFLRHRVLARSA